MSNMDYITEWKLVRYAWFEIKEKPTYPGGFWLQPVLHCDGEVSFVFLTETNISFTKISTRLTATNCQTCVNDFSLVK